MVVPQVKDGMLASTGDLTDAGKRQLKGVNEFLTTAGQFSSGQATESEVKSDLSKAVAGVTSTGSNGPGQQAAQMLQGDSVPWRLLGAGLAVLALLWALAGGGN